MVFSKNEAVNEVMNEDDDTIYSGILPKTKNDIKNI